jgi:hypothetical protein
MSRHRNAVEIIHLALEVHGHEPVLLSRHLGDPSATFACWDVPGEHLVTMYLEDDESVTILRFPGKAPVERFRSLDSMAFYLEPTPEDAKA